MFFVGGTTLFSLVLRRRVRRPLRRRGRAPSRRRSAQAERRRVLPDGGSRGSPLRLENFRLCGVYRSAPAGSAAGSADRRAAPFDPSMPIESSDNADRSPWSTPRRLRVLRGPPRISVCCVSPRSAGHGALPVSRSTSAVAPRETPCPWLVWAGRLSERIHPGRCWSLPRVARTTTGWPHACELSARRWMRSRQGIAHSN